MSRWTDPRFPDMVHHIDPRARAEARRSNELSGPLDPGNTTARTVNPDYATQVRFGNIVTMNGGNSKDRQRILSADLAQLEQKEQWHSGAWVLSLQSKFVSVPSDFNQPCLLTAEISMGAGGASIVFEVSAFPGFIIQIPASNVTVTLKWDPPVALGGSSIGVSPQNINVLVSGILQRGESGRSARRAIFFPFTDAASNAGGGFWTSGSLASNNIQGLIPPFAKSVRPIGDSEQAPMFNADPGLAFLVLKPVDVGVDISGFALKQLMLSGDSLPIPPGAALYDCSTSGSAILCGLDFEISL